ncbi:MAG: hypothetical protein KatS3mg016_1024 [Fimbriimonadales bacterium]|nr:MAG: hypothetical protein KatS3mg016_1024 [Fimbriimonadales bacterium]
MSGLGRLLRGLAIWIGLSVLLTGTHMGILYGINALRTRYETALETRGGAELVDREPPYSGGERLIVALDIQPSIYWAEALIVSAVMSLVVAVFVGLASLAFRQGRAVKLILVALIVNGLVFYFYALLSEQIFVGYQLGRPVSAVAPAILVGLAQGIVSVLVLGGKK